MIFDQDLLHDFPDRALRKALQHPQNPRDVVALARPELVAHLDFSQAEYLTPAFLLEDWREREADLLCRVPYRVSATDTISVMICLLLEHQSQPDSRLPLRLLLYAVLFWEQQWKEYEKRHAPGESLTLTLVVPIVFHTGSRPWNSNRTVADLFAGLEALRVFGPTWPVVFWDLAAKSADELLGSDGPFTQFLSIVRVEDSEREEFARVVEACARRLEPLCEQDTMRWRDLLKAMLGWIHQRRPHEESDTMSALVVASQQGARAREEATAVSTEAKETCAQWYQREAAERVAEKAKVQGRLEAFREMLISEILKKVAAVPPDLAASIQACDDAAKLQAAIRHVRTLSSLEEFTL